MKGFETFFEANKRAFKTKQDVIVATMHFMLVHEYDFVCLGTGETFPTPEEPRSELLPSGWNAGNDTFSIRYASSRAETLRLQLKGVLMGDMLLLTLFNADSASAEIHSTTLKVNNFITDTPSLSTSSRAEVFVGGDESKLEAELKKDFVDIRGQKKATGSQTDIQIPADLQEHGQANLPGRPVIPPAFAPQPVIIPHPGPAPFQVYPPPGHPMLQQPRNNYIPGAAPPFPPRIGGADLDPFNGGLNAGGGMLFDPFRGGLARNRAPFQPHLPPGAVPPGARFDPFGPPQAGGRFARPDPDNEPPPPGADDMFM